MRFSFAFHKVDTETKHTRNILKLVKYTLYNINKTHKTKNLFPEEIP